MISVRDAQAQVLARITTIASPEIVPLAAALGRVLAEDVRAEMDVPPTDNSAVDGYAVASADIPATGTRAFDVAAELAAGAVFSGTLRSGQTLRIMTGAPMPAGADSVYPQEVVAREGARITVGSIAPGANRRLRGEDVRAGQIVLPAGSVLRPQEIGVAASLGLAQLYGRQQPRGAAVSTGGEGVEPCTSAIPEQTPCCSATAAARTLTAVRRAR